MNTYFYVNHKLTNKLKYYSVTIHFVFDSRFGQVVWLRLIAMQGSDYSKYFFKRTFNCSVSGCKSCSIFMHFEMYKYVYQLFTTHSTSFAKFETRWRFKFWFLINLSINIISNNVLYCSRFRVFLVPPACYRKRTQASSETRCIWYNLKLLMFIHVFTSPAESLLNRRKYLRYICLCTFIFRCFEEILVISFRWSSRHALVRYSNKIKGVIPNF